MGNLELLVHLYPCGIVFGLCEEAGAPGENPGRHGENLWLPPTIWTENLHKVTEAEADTDAQPEEPDKGNVCLLILLPLLIW